MQYEELSLKKRELDSLLPFAPEKAEELRKKIELEIAYVGGFFDGSDLSRKETASILYQDETVAGHSLTAHLKVINSAKSFELIQDLSKKVGHQIDDVDVKNIHRVVVRNLDDKNGGMYRGFKRTFQVGEYDLPDSVRVQRVMNDFGMWLFAATTLHPVALATEAHFRLMSIQPFGQGNACTARFLMNLILMRYGFPPAVFTRREKKEYWESLVSAIFKNDRELYDKLVYRAVNRSLDLYMKASQTSVVEDVDSEPYFLRIGQLAKESGERVSSLRYWTSLGLLETTGRTSAGYTLYSSEVLPQIQKLKAFKEERYTLDEIRKKLSED